LEQRPFGQYVFMKISAGKIKQLLYLLIKVRLVEERIAQIYPNDEMKCPVHLSTGSEAVSVGVCCALRKKDFVVGGHRSHGIYLAKGGNLNEFMAELYGRKTGCCGGKGGSMHLSSIDVGLMGTTPILGATIPIGVGLALASKIKKEDKVTAIFFGDGSTEEGAFYESLNLASLKKVPAIFICENNKYSIFQKQSARQPLDNLYEKGKAFGIPGKRVNGNDVLEVYEVALEAIKHAKKEGPYLIEGVTSRWKQHVGPYYDYELGYDVKENLDFIMQHEDPVKNFVDWGKRKNLFGDAEVKEVTIKLKGEIEDALKFVVSSPEPTLEDLHTNLY